MDIDPRLTDVLTELAWEARAEGARCVARLVTEHARDHVVNSRANDPSCSSVSIRVTPELEQMLRARAEAKGPKETAVQSFEAYLQGRVVNQEQAIRVVTPALKRMRASLERAGPCDGRVSFPRRDRGG